jgi:hypothetical protein
MESLHARLRYNRPFQQYGNVSGSSRERRSSSIQEHLRADLRYLGARLASRGGFHSRRRDVSQAYVISTKVRRVRPRAMNVPLRSVDRRTEIDQPTSALPLGRSRRRRSSTDIAGVGIRQPPVAECLLHDFECARAWLFLSNPMSASSSLGRAPNAFVREKERLCVQTIAVQLRTAHR